MTEIEKLASDAWFRDNIFCMNYYYAADKESYIALLEYFGLDTPNLDASNGRCTLHRKDNTIGIFIGTFVDELDVLVHEATHAALWTFEFIEQELTYNDEVLPCLVGYIIRECNKRRKTKETPLSEYEQKASKQPNGKSVVRISLDSFAVVKEYPSISSAIVDGFAYKKISQAIKDTAIYHNFLWAFKGEEENQIEKAKLQKTILRRIHKAKFIPPTKEELISCIKNNMSNEYIAQKFNCSPQNIIYYIYTKYKIPRKDVVCEIN